jgi:hypothetical protein
MAVAWGERQQVCSPPATRACEGHRAARARLAFAEARDDRRSRSPRPASAPAAGHLRLARVLRAGGDFRAALKHLGWPAGLRRRRRPRAPGETAASCSSSTAATTPQLCLQSRRRGAPAAGDAVARGLAILARRAAGGQLPAWRTSPPGRRGPRREALLLPVRLTPGQRALPPRRLQGAQAAFVATPRWRSRCRCPGRAKALDGQAGSPSAAATAARHIALFRQRAVAGRLRRARSPPALRQPGLTFADVASSSRPSLASRRRPPPAPARPATGRQSQALSQLSLAWLYRASGTPQVRQICERRLRGRARKKPNVLASVRAAAGQVMAETGEIDDALRELGFAHRTFTELGARFRRRRGVDPPGARARRAQSPRSRASCSRRPASRTPATPAWSELLPQRHLVLARLDSRRGARGGGAPPRPGPRAGRLAGAGGLSQERAAHRVQGLLAEGARLRDEDGAAADWRAPRGCCRTRPLRCRPASARASSTARAGRLPRRSRSPLPPSCGSTAQVPSAPIAWWRSRGGSPASAPPRREGRATHRRRLEKLREVSPTPRRRPQPATVLNRGESGTGKELLAEMIHAGSFAPGQAAGEGQLRGDGRGLLLSELSATRRALHRRGARPQGPFELADGGTLFLDEIATSAAAPTVALLRVLQERVFGACGPGPCAWTCAWSAPPTATGAMVAAAPSATTSTTGCARCSSSAPLRERSDDIPQLATTSARCAQEGQESQEEALPRAWPCCGATLPGNIRELQTCCAGGHPLAQRGALRGDLAGQGAGALGEGRRRSQRAGRERVAAMRRRRSTDVRGGAGQLLQAPARERDVAGRPQERVEHECIKAASPSAAAASPRGAAAADEAQRLSDRRKTSPDCADFGSGGARSRRGRRD